MLNDLITEFITFFTVIDPMGTVPVFIAITASYSDKSRRAIAIKATLIASGVLLFFIFAGEFILNGANIPLSSFQIAGGLVLLIFALSMIFGEGKPEEEIKQLDKDSDKAIFPLAIPSLASPGAMLASVLLTKNSTNSFIDQSITVAIMFSVMFIALFFMLIANRMFKYIGNAGAALISRVMGLILSSVAVSNIIDGIKISFNL